MHDYLYNDIFGERPESIVQRETRQKTLRKLTDELDKFLDRNQHAVELGHGVKVESATAKKLWEELGLPEMPPAEQIFTKGSHASEARRRFLAAVDRFVEQAKESVRSCR